MAADSAVLSTACSPSSASQKWLPLRATDGSYLLQVDGSDRQCLSMLETSAAGTRVGVSGCNEAAPDQMFMLPGSVPWQASSHDPMAGWKVVRAGHAHRTLRMDVVGDSTSQLCGQGTGPANCANLWTNVVKTAGQAAWGDGGSGYASFGNNPRSVQPNVTLYGSGFTWLSGSSSVGPAQSNGRASDFGTLLLLPSADTASNFMGVSGIDGDATAVFGAIGAGYTSCTTNIKGPGVDYFGPILTQSSATLQGAMDSHPHAAGTMTAYFNGSPGRCAITGVGGYRSSPGGFVLNNFAHGYAGTGAFCTAPEVQLFMAKVAPFIPAAVVFALGINNLNNAVPIDLATYTRLIQRCGNYYKSIDPNVSIILMNENATGATMNSLGLTAANVRSALAMLAHDNGWVFLDEMSVLGTLANAEAHGWIGADHTHLTDAGSSVVGHYVAAFLNQ
jgi:hypothetical protein